MLHLIRRNVNLKVLLFNNRIYGLTKGQYSPTTAKGTKTKSSPMGSLDAPMRPLSFALGVGSTFAARSMATDVKHLEYVLDRAAKHVGTAFVEIDQNRVIFNDGVFKSMNEKDLKAAHRVYTEHGKPLVFGKNREKGIRLNRLAPEIVSVADHPDDILIHDEQEPTSAQAFLLSNLSQPDFPEPFGVFRAVDRDTLDELVHNQIHTAQVAKPNADLQGLLNGSETWITE